MQCYSKIIPRSFQLNPRSLQNIPGHYIVITRSLQGHLKVIPGDFRVIPGQSKLSPGDCRSQQVIKRSIKGHKVIPGDALHMS